MAEGPTYVYGDMWSVWGQLNTAFIITTNGYVTKAGDLVMGRGIAEQLRNKDRQWARFFGAYIQWGKEIHQERYGCLVWNTRGLKEQFGSYRVPMCWVGIFQVKHHFRGPAAPDLIEHSAGMLRYVAVQHPDRIFHLNYPGIGFGRLTEAVVEPLLRQLPSNVHVWRFPTQCYDVTPVELEPDELDEELEIKPDDSVSQGGELQELP